MVNRNFPNYHRYIPKGTKLVLIDVSYRGGVIKHEWVPGVSEPGMNREQRRRQDKFLRGASERKKKDDAIRARYDRTQLRIKKQNELRKK